MLQEKIEVLVKQGKLIDLNTLYNCSQEQLKNIIVQKIHYKYKTYCNVLLTNDDKHYFNAELYKARYLKMSKSLYNLIHNEWNLSFKIFFTINRH